MKMRNIILAYICIYLGLCWCTPGLFPATSCSAAELQFAAVLNRSADNSTAIILEAIRYSIAQSQSLVAPHSILLNELEVDPQPQFALAPFQQLYAFTVNPNRPLHGGLDGTANGLAKYFLSNSSVRQKSHRNACLFRKLFRFWPRLKIFFFSKR
jgi:hypothetical protein